MQQLDIFDIWKRCCSLQRLAARFEAALGDAQEPDSAWWPAWLLVEQPLLAPALDDAGYERGFKLLQALHGGLYAAYMAPR